MILYEENQNRKYGIFEDIQDHKEEVFKLS